MIAGIELILRPPLAGLQLRVAGTDISAKDQKWKSSNGGKISALPPGGDLNRGNSGVRA